MHTWKDPKDEMDQQGNMDLSLSADFNSAILSCWDDYNGAEAGGANGKSRPDSTSAGAVTTMQSSNGNESAAGKAALMQSMNEGFSRLPSFPTAIGGTATGQNNDASAADQAAANLANAYGMQLLNPLVGGDHVANQMQGSMHVPQHMMMQYALNGGAPFSNISFVQKNQPDTMSNLSTTGSLASAKDSGVSSINIAPVNGGNTGTAPGQHSSQLHPLGIQSSAICPPHMAMSSPNAMHFNPFMFNPFMPPAMLAANPELMAAFQATQQQIAFSASQIAASQATTPQVKSEPTVLPPPVLPPPPPAPTHASTAAATTQPKSAPKKKSNKNSNKAAPPFLLFDAPCELRANFMATQRMLNLPVHQDGNSYHYGMAVNGFHPQSNVTSMDTSSSLSSVRLVDSRQHKKRGAVKERNEREQKRAQKITELIDRLRVSMEDGGWKVEMKNKYHTLSSCADYMKHLKQSTEEKEEAVNKAKSELEVKERKLEDKSMQESRSDPESVTSSLTSASTRSSNEQGDGEKRRSSSDASSGNKRKADQLEPESANEAASKKAKENESTAESLETDDRGSGGPGGHSISFGKMSSCVSEITDSNRGSSDSGGEKFSGAAHKKRPHGNVDESGALPSTTSVSTTAAVIRGSGSERQKHSQADVVIKKNGHSRSRKRSRSERSSLDRKFDLDYDEVFLKSNVPQLIATPAGRVVQWNDFFLKATGLSKEKAQVLTIFSLVKPDKLANLFEMVAEALRQNSASETGSASNTSSGCTSNEAGSSSENGEGVKYATMTLPCMTFPVSRSRGSDGVAEKRNPLHMTLTLMPDDDVNKRCFHCVFTDCPGTNGQLGFITPELLAKLFAEPVETTTKHESRSSHKAETKSKVHVHEVESLRMEMYSAIDDVEDDEVDYDF